MAVAKIFSLKFNQFKDDLMKGQVLSHVEYIIDIKEDQIRGLQHAHVIVHNYKDDGPRSAAEVDMCISTEIPDAKQNKTGLTRTVPSRQQLLK